MKIVITGGPLTGKTTYADELGERYGCPVFHTDDLIDLGWSQASDEATNWLDKPGDWIIEGVAVSRTLRKWRKLHPGRQCPVNLVVYMSSPLKPLSKGQKAMSKGVKTVTDELTDWLCEGNGRFWVCPTPLEPKNPRKGYFS